MHAHDTAITLFQVQPDNHIRKLPKDALDLTNALNLNKLLFHEIHSFHSSQKLPLSDSFQAQNEFCLNQTTKDDLEECQFIIRSCQSIIPESEDTTIPSWAGIRALLSITLVPRKHVGFVPYLPVGFFPKSSNRVFYNFQCYEKLHSTRWVAKARCTPTFLRWRCFEDVSRYIFTKARPVSKFDANAWRFSHCGMYAT